MRFLRYLAVATLAASAAGCGDVLNVDNENNPDRQRVLGKPSDVEALAGAQFQQIMLGTLGATARTQTGMMTASFMNASGLANNGLGPFSSIPREPILNSRGNPYQNENYNDFRILSGVARNSSDILARVKGSGFALGGPASANRLKAWTHYVYGVSLGYLSLVYDSAAIPRTTDAATAVPALESYQAVNTFALAQFDSAIAYINQPGTSAIPSAWVTNGIKDYSPADFTRLVRSFKARMRASVARTPAERAAVDWNAVIADATAGINADYEVAMNPTAGWDYAWLSSALHFRDANWHQMTYYIIGMADVSGAFDTWLSMPRDSRAYFTIVTPDLRFPRGATRAAQNDVGQGAPTTNAATGDTPRRYFRNRLPGLDQAATGWRNSQYDHYRFRAFADANRIGNFPIFTRAENDMLAAEGHIRRGNITAAAALIDRTRTTAGLPALAGAVTSETQPVPGGAQCVPRVPVGPTFTSTACGNTFEAMKWEKRMETAYTTYGAWFFDSRGWGDLPIGTAIHWPVPNQEADARLMPIYNLGGVGQPGGAGPSTYGYGNGSQ